jgi:hypothetical protein
VKRRDDELYGPFQREGYELVHRFDPRDHREHGTKVLFVPLTDQHGQESRDARAQAFRNAAHDMLRAGDWVIYCDDVIYLSKALGLRVELEELWAIGRSEGISVVASAQEPVNIPPMAWGQSSHLFIFKNPDMYRTRRLGELTGFNRELAFATILRLPPHEFLYINKDTSEMVRSMVLRR